MSRLEVRNLRVTVGSRRLLDVGTLEVEAGALVVIAGASGSGKTVFTRALAGAIDAEGDVLLEGRTQAGRPSQRRRNGLAVAVRDGTRVAGCTVAEALALAGADRRAVLERLPALANRDHVHAQLLSGGEQQLLQLACAFSARPKVLVLDSPTVGLATEAAGAIAAWAAEAARGGCAVLWLEQDLRAAPADAAYELATGTLAPAAGSAPVPA